jgi:hypothetical protein
MHSLDDQFHLTINLTQERNLHVRLGVPSEHGLRAARAFIFAEGEKRVTFWAVQPEITETVIKLIAQYLVDQA